MHKPRVGILTTFTGADESYSLVNVVGDQLQMLLDGGYAPVLFVAPVFKGTGVFSEQSVEIRKVARPNAGTKDVVEALDPLVSDIDVMLCHDILFLSQHESWAKAIRKIAGSHSNIAWLHWQHSRGDHPSKTSVPRGWFCYPNNGDLEHVAKLNQVALKRVRYIPHPLDLRYLGWPSLAVQIAEDFNFPFVDVSGILPTRLDREKQVERAVRIFAGLKKAGRTVCFLVADASATGVRFKVYKQEVLTIARENGLGPKEFAFLGDVYESCEFSTPRQVVKALFEMSNLFVLPSNAETSSLVAMEAALAGNLVVLNSDFPPIHHLYKKALTFPFGSVLEPDVKYYRTIVTADGEEQKIEDPQAFWDDSARIDILPVLDSQLCQAVKRQQLRDRWPSKVFKEYMEPLILEAHREVGGSVPLGNPVVGDAGVTAIISTLDNLPMLKQQLPLLLEEVGHVIVVNNGSNDGTEQWLGRSSDPLDPRVVVINRENLGAGPGRNAGLGEWKGSTPYVLMLDGGILPLRGGVAAMRVYLEEHQDVDVISPEVASCYTTDRQKAHVRLAEIDPTGTFEQRALSGTACALCRAKAWKDLRFSEEGPFGQPGWGVDDNEMQCRWNEAGIVHHDFTGVRLFRRQSGSFKRLFEETGIYPNQYGSVYEQRNVLLSQQFPQYYDPTWHTNHIKVSCVVLGWNEYPMFARTIKRIHEDLKGVPHEVIFVNNGSEDATKWWLDTFALRWPWGDATVEAVTGANLWRKEHEELEDVWTGDVIRVDLPENMGTGFGYNAGFEVARGDYIFYLSGDILPTKGSVLGLVEYLDNHGDVDYVGVNPWVSQDENEDPEYTGFESNTEVEPPIYHPPQGLGNYAGSYAVFRRKILDEGCKLADEGPFAGAGCGYEEAEFANLMYQQGCKCLVFNGPGYYHQRRDFRRSGHDEGDLEEVLEERRNWLSTRWPSQDFGITHYAPVPERHIRKVAVIHKDIPAERKGTIWTISDRIIAALSGICKAKRFLPGEEEEGWDNYFYIDNGDYDYFSCPELAHPSIFWAIDMVVPPMLGGPSPDEYVKRGKTFDRVFAACRSARDYFREKGVEATWLPPAASIDYHRPWNEGRTYDWVALWHNTQMRIDYTQLAREKYIGSYYVGYVEGEVYAQWISRGKCVINVARVDGLNMRIFEAMAIGTPLITSRVSDLDLLFNEGEHYLGHDDPDELVRQIDWVQENFGEALAMAARARDEVLSKHTFYHRALSLFGS